MSTHLSVINGEFIPADQARISISDLSIQRGYGIFDFFKVLNGRPIFLDAHLDRFYRSASLLRLPVQQTREELKDLLGELLRRNAQPSCGVRLTLTGGHSDDGYSIGSPNLLVTQRALPNNKALADRGIRLMTHAHQRQIPEAKSIDYLMPIWLGPVLREKGADDVLYHCDGLISECPRSNLFVVTPDDRLLTPARNILRGVIREKVLELAPQFIQGHETDVPLQSLTDAKEIFMTSTTKNILPVVALDGKPVGSGEPGPVSKELYRLLYARLEND
jgi:D-alanine transaminase/branched-chain amino acid aminotransferase